MRRGVPAGRVGSWGGLSRELGASVAEGAGGMLHGEVARGGSGHTGTDGASKSWTGVAACCHLCAPAGAGTGDP